ncbi:acyltransferase domain-containing protein [Roseateles asaccharophilus]|uniref:[acyl-carrier-protein] S-malonyltransferase n=1 Tax=Roseateles asaccharophilus TaxID=582607 RepID=A0ABU2A6P7_9BURK|nr:acyltransferase domain-containing protein [Roseateles asaccharophilus]MDR7332884.1 [acyl-carrier-protein] S-malonyltransferase [Roseateles asaccharophilus]
MLALLFPGQGAQHAGMLPWLDARPEAAPLLQALTRQLGRDWRDGLADAAWLHRNTVAQPLLTGVCVAAWQALAARLPVPGVVAGYSVGELAACSAAGVFDADTALALAAARAQAMDAAVAGRATGLLAVQGPGAARLVEELPIAIHISAERVIIGGGATTLDDCAARWTGAGLRCTRLPIAIASHTPAMAPAATAFAQRLAATPLRPARVPVVCNFNAAAQRQPAQLGAALAGQIASTVRWDECMDAIAERQPRCVLEAGPGASLAAMWRERHPGIPVRSVDEFGGPDGVADWVRRQLG